MPAKSNGTIQVYWAALPSVKPLGLAGSMGHDQVPSLLRCCT